MLNIKVRCALADFASSLVSSIIAITLIEMILPNGKNKKYITFVSSIILIVVIINPVISFFNRDFNLENILESQEDVLINSEYSKKIQYDKERNINDTYKAFLQEDITKRLEENGYFVRNIDVIIDKKSYEPLKMELEIEHDDGYVQKVVIDVSKNISNSISDMEIAKIKEMLNGVYGTKKDQIKINNF